MYNILFVLVLLVDASAREFHDVSKSTASSTEAGKHSTQAYVTLLYSDNFVVAVRVLGISLRESGAERDLVAIVAGDISAANLATLKTDGWLIHHVPTIQNPSLWTQNKGGKGFPPRFWGVYTKLTIFNLTQYDRVVYLDADTIASRNVDELFLCDGFCAVLRHSERFNSGVMVLEPSAATFADMLHRIYDTPSYTGGDQGFLNEYFSEFSNSPLFLPRAGKLLSQSASSWKDSKGRRLARLPTEYNADLGLYVANSNRWMIPKDQLGIIHYTLATFKPWQWWSSWILSENGRRWQELRARLPAGADGGGDGGSNRSSSRSTLQGLLGPLVLAVLIVRRWCWTRGLGACWRCWMGCGERVGGRRSAVVGIYARNEQPGGVRLPLGFRPLAAVAGAGSLGIAVVVAVGRIVPPQSKPRIGWLMAYEWVTLLTLLCFAQFLRLCYYWGQRRPGKSVFSVSCHSLKKDEGFACGESSRPWAESLVGTAGLVATLSLLPWWTDIFGVTSFTGKILGTGVAGVFSTAVCIMCFIAVAEQWFICGVVEGVTFILPVVKE